MIVGVVEAVPVWGTTRVIRFSLNKKLSARLSCEKNEKKEFASRKNSTDWACYFIKVGSGRTLVHRCMHVKKILDSNKVRSTPPNLARGPSTSQLQILT
jgi:hypothetical protein